jgi:Flp pilus assembly protein TadG
MITGRPVSLARFARAKGGNVAAMFAIALVPILGFVGAAVDYSRANSARSAMQGALDSAALMVSKDIGAAPANAPLSSTEITDRARRYFNALYTSKDAVVTSFSANYTANTGKGATVALSGAGDVTTDFMKIMGIKKMTIDGGSTTTWGGTRMRVAMALDVTGSMNDDGKLAAMKTAAKSLVASLQKSMTNVEDVYLAIIPFAQMVNVGNSNVNANWIKWDLYEAANGSCSKSSYDSKSECESNGRTWTPAGRSSWNGCVTDRDQPADTTKAAPTTASTYYPAFQYAQCPAQILPMTSVYTYKIDDDTHVVNKKINSLVAQGGTNQPIGMAWAWQALQPGVPLNTPAKDPKWTYTDVVILLSDGQNTIDRWYGNGSSYSSQVDARQTILCNNMKTTTNNVRDTLIYTIQVNTDNDPESAVLKACGDSGFFPTSTSSGIATAFNAISASLNQLRVAK